MASLDKFWTKYTMDWILIRIPITGDSHQYVIGTSCDACEHFIHTQLQLSYN